MEKFPKCVTLWWWRKLKTDAWIYDNIKYFKKEAIRYKYLSFNCYEQICPDMIQKRAFSVLKQEHAKHI